MSADSPQTPATGRSRTALLVVDVQNDFCPGGSLATAGGGRVAEDVAEHLRQHARDYAAVVATRDWHDDPGDHWSDEPDFRDSWPVHCAAGTHGAALHPALEAEAHRLDAVFHKGRHEAAYSGFEGHLAEQGDLSHGSQAPVMLATWLRDQGIERVEVCGIATDHCVRATVIDALSAGFTTHVLLGLTSGVAPETTSAAVEDMERAGATTQGQPRLEG